MNTHLGLAGLVPAVLLALTGSIGAQLTPDWASTSPVGSALASGLAGFVVDAAGNSYLTGTGGPSGNTDVVTVSFGPDGSFRWRHDYNGPVNWHDQGRGIGLGPDGIVWVTGNTPAASKHANVLLLKYDATTGELLTAIRYSSGAGIAEHGASVVADADGNVYVGGGTVGDGGDALILSFDSEGTLRWRQQWDGAAWGPYSQDSVRKVLLDPQGNLDVLLNGNAADLQPDYYVNEYDAATGETLFEATWGTRAGESNVDMEIDAAGDVFVTGTGLDLTNKYSTVKFDGVHGALIWQAYDFAAIDDVALALALDDAGDVYVTGSVDPDGDFSNYNDDIYTVKRDGITGNLLWSHRYGDPCKFCFDVPSDLVVDSGGNLFLAGWTSSSPYSGVVITFVLDSRTGVEAQRGVVASGVGTGILRLDGAENLYNGGGTYDSNTGAKAVSVFKYGSLRRAVHTLDVANLISGQRAVFTVSNATPFAWQYLVFGIEGPGSVWIRSLEVTLGVASPRLLVGLQVGGAGDLRLEVPVPTGIRGLPMWFQVAEMGGVTPVVPRTVL